jgi:hypothetical protein
MEKDDNRVNILGYSKSRLEIFLNGIVFLLLQSIYEAIYVGMQLPNNWTDKDFADAERPMLVPIMLLVICYILINMSIFGGEGRIEKMQEKYGTFGILTRKLLMYLILILSASIIPVLLIIAFF